MKTKHYLLLAVISQFIVATMNMVIFMTSLKQKAFYPYFYMYVPSFLATSLITVYYWKYRNEKRKRARGMALFVCIPVNIIFMGVSFVSQDNYVISQGYYFIATAIALLVNALFVMKYGMKSVEKKVVSKNVFILQLLLFLSMMVSLVAMFLSNLDQLTSTACSAFASISLMLAYWRLQHLYTRRH